MGRPGHNRAVASFCSRCGAENPAVARHCGDCGALLDDAGDGHHAPEPPPLDEEAETPLAPPPVLCVRCGAPTHEASHCPLCGALQPLPTHRDDPFIRMTLAEFPLLLRSPRQRILEMPYRNTPKGLLFPTVGIALAAAAGWTLAALPSFLPMPATAGPALSLPALAQATGAIALLAPWVFLGYAACWQGVALLLGGSGTLERTARALAMLLIPSLVVLGGLGAYVRLSQLLALQFAPNPGELATGSAAWPVYQVLPYLFIYGFVLYGAVAVAYHAIVLAAANWMDQGRTILLHVVLGVAVGLYLLLARRG